ncbi:hypothetical protein Pan189_26370 [Stratiformator vulcanicus]|uniref:Uncharacterized protein n=2 Tax=Stratiformator vulcanicus TaxID=2527980 RepID=A0A517R331_9PLAN|nr:hypothetical protein Pan189_26370 [Stratiformator vulcanicus]
MSTDVLYGDERTDVVQTVSLRPIGSSEEGKQPEARRILYRHDRQRLENIMGTRVALKINNASIIKLADSIAEQFDVAIRIDQQAVVDHGLSIEEEFSVDWPDISIADIWGSDEISGWQIIAERRGFALTNAASCDFYETHLVNVADLIESGFSRQDIRCYLYAASSGPWRKLDGAGGRMRFFRGTMQLTQTQPCQREVAELLELMAEQAKVIQRNNLPERDIEPCECRESRLDSEIPFDSSAGD